MNRHLSNMLLFFGPSLVMGLALTITSLTITGCTHVVSIKGSTQVEAENSPFQYEFGDVAHIASSVHVIVRRCDPNDDTTWVRNINYNTEVLYWVKTKYLTQCFCGRGE